MKACQSVLILSVSLFLTLFFPASCNNAKAKNTGLLSRMTQKAQESQNLAQKKVIEAAVSAFDLEQGRPPQTIDELVEYGYLEPRAVLDANGEKLSLDDYRSSSPGNTGSGLTLIEKSCGACGKSVPLSSKVGDRCPHCGVVWGHETQTFQ